MGVRRVSNARVTEALRETNGNVQRAEAMLGLDLTARLRQIPSLWPKGIARRGPGHSSEADGQKITDAIRASAGSVDGAAAALGISPSAVRARLLRKPSLWPEGVHRPAAAPREPTSENAIARVNALTKALRATNGDRTRAAKLLGVTRQAVSNRLLAHPEWWPEGVPTKRQRTRVCDDETMLATLRATQGHQRRAAALLGVTERHVSEQLTRHPEGWPPEFLKTIGADRPLVRSVREMLRTCEGNQSETARRLGVNRCTVTRILRWNPEAWPDGVERPPLGYPFRKRKAVA